MSHAPLSYLVMSTVRPKRVAWRVWRVGGCSTIKFCPTGYFFFCIINSNNVIQFIKVPLYKFWVESSFSIFTCLFLLLNINFGSYVKNRNMLTILISVDYDLFIFVNNSVVYVIVLYLCYLNSNYCRNAAIWIDEEGHMDLFVNNCTCVHLSNLLVSTRGCRCRCRLVGATLDSFDCMVPCSLHCTFHSLNMWNSFRPGSSLPLHIF